MTRSSSTNRSKLPRRTRLAASLALVIGTSALAMPGIAAVVEVPLSWPLAHERSAQLTPLRARMQAMQIARPASSEHVGAVREVTNCADDGSTGSLRALVAASISGDTIDLTGLACDRITLTEGVIDIEVDDLTLRGPGASALTIDGNAADRVLRHAASGTLTIENLTLAHGRHVATGTDIGYGGCLAAAGNVILSGSVVRDCTAIGVGSYGGGVLSGPLTMRNSTISGNTAFGDHPTNGTAAYGGGAFSYGVDLVDSTISGNSAIGTHNPPLSHWEIGGGLFVARNGGIIERSTIDNNYAMRFAGGLTQEGDLILRNSTISGNRARDDDGGGMRVRQVTAVFIENSTIAGNQAGSFGGGVSFINHALPSLVASSLIANNRSGSGDIDIESTMPLSISGSHNLVGRSAGPLLMPGDTITGDPLLAPLAANGGSTRTHALGAASPARDRGSNPQALATDQRGTGFPRVTNDMPDIGAFEVQGGGGGSGAIVELPSGSTWSAVLLAAFLTFAAWFRRRLSMRQR